LDAKLTTLLAITAPAGVVVAEVLVKADGTETKD